MSRRTARGNRLGLALVGAILTAAAAAALTRAFTLWPAVLGKADAPVLDQPTRDFAADQPWFWPSAATLTVLAALLALRWLAVQTRSDALKTIRLEPDPRRGATTLPAHAVTRALEDDLGQSPYVRGTGAQLTGSAWRPHLLMTVTLHADADAAEAKERISQALDRLGQALETEHVTATVHIRSSRT